VVQKIPLSRQPVTRISNRVARWLLHDVSNIRLDIVKCKRKPENKRIYPENEDFYMSSPLVLSFDVLRGYVQDIIVGFSLVYVVHWMSWMSF
jgi:hypothetical protein